jgi:monovalent cation/hydrogen antiporter
VPLVHDGEGTVIHPRLLEQYAYRKRTTATLKDEADFPADLRNAHYDVVLVAIAAGRVNCCGCTAVD